jgi:hypothetical protein
MKDENEIKLKRAYWQGVFDALKTPEKGRSDRIDKDKLTSEVWLSALDWILGQKDEPTSSIGNTEENKH